MLFTLKHIAFTVKHILTPSSAQLRSPSFRITYGKPTSTSMRSIWNGFMVWLILTEMSQSHTPATRHAWSGMCLPIKILVHCELDRKPLEQDPGLMLQKQKIDHVF